jgi:hypothetical protein
VISVQLSSGPWLEKALLLYDQAYFDYRKMDLIDANGGWFVTRLKPNALVDEPFVFGLGLRGGEITAHLL